MGNWNITLNGSSTCDATIDSNGNASFPINLTDLKKTYTITYTNDNNKSFTTTYDIPAGETLIRWYPCILKISTTIILDESEHWGTEGIGSVDGGDSDWTYQLHPTLNIQVTPFNQQTEICGQNFYNPEFDEHLLDSLQLKFKIYGIQVEHHASTGVYSDLVITGNAIFDHADSIDITSNTMYGGINNIDDIFVLSGGGGGYDCINEVKYIFNILNDDNQPVTSIEIGGTTYQIQYIGGNYDSNTGYTTVTYNNIGSGSGSGSTQDKTCSECITIQKISNTNNYYVYNKGLSGCSKTFTVYYKTGEISDVKSVTVLSSNDSTNKVLVNNVWNSKISCSSSFPTSEIDPNLEPELNPDGPEIIP